MPISIKIHRSYRLVVAVCDVNLLGKRFEEDIRQLEIRESFFKGEIFEEEDAIKILKKQSLEDATFNIVGKEAIQAAIKSQIIASEGITKINEIPFALVLI